MARQTSLWIGVDMSRPGTSKQALRERAWSLLARRRFGRFALALRQGKDVYVAVPRLRAARCFFDLDPRRPGPARLAAASTIGGPCTIGRCSAAPSR
jgi:hypothetical protein